MHASPSQPLPPSASIPSRSRRALVFGGGGSTGNAWLIGVIAGLSASGFDHTTADLVIGTSAGATAAAQLAGASPAELYDDVLRVPTTVPGVLGRGVPAPAAPPRRGHVPDHLRRMHELIADSESADELRRRLGASALQRLALSDDTWQERWRATVAARLRSEEWPQRQLRLTTIDAHTGDAVVLDRTSGVSLVDAVAASTSSGLPYRVGDRWLLDGAFRRGENADLAVGYSRVLVLAPFSGRSLTPPEWGQQLDAQRAELRASGSSVVTVFPGDDLDHLFFANAMDLSLRPEAARAGYARGAELAADVAVLWR